MRSRSRLGLLAGVTAAGLLATGLAVASPTGGARALNTRTELTAMHTTGRATGAAAKNPFCAGLGTRYQASAGAQGYCFGAQPSVGGRPGSAMPDLRAAKTSGVATNVDAANLAEDVNHGVRADGQSETSIAAAGGSVVEAWNDATAFYSTCKSIQNKAEITGVGYSDNGGISFADIGGLPNANCDSYLFEGDPSVAAYQADGKDWYYISSLYDSASGSGPSQIAMDVCQAAGKVLNCNAHPVVIANSTYCRPGGKICDFMDKDFITIDPKRHRLYASYTDFPVNSTTATTSIDATMCSLNNPAKPVCMVNKPGKPTYETLAKAGATPCENEGAYPAVDEKTGDLYVAYEFNWFSSTSLAACTRDRYRVSEILDHVPGSCLTPTPVARCGVANQVTVPIISMENSPPPGYSRFNMNDFPRVAVSGPYGTVSMVWNDAKYNPLGDVEFQSFHLGSLANVQKSPVLLTYKPQSGIIVDAFMPALRMANAAGKLDITWYYQYANPGVSLTTSVNGVQGLAPTATAPATGTWNQVSDASSYWSTSVSNINPNFGDYTDNYIDGSTVYVAWSDGRIGIPQPYEMRLPA